MLRASGVISLLTDFGVGDAYVGEMKGVILSICPTVTLVDISHSVLRHDVLQGAFVLSQAAPYFPEGSIHLVVVDPGVGTARKKIVLQGRRCFYVGPDNGVLSLAAEREGVVRAVEIRNEEFMLPRLSGTFEGRDVFAPVAAHLAGGVDIGVLGPDISNFERISLAKPEKRGDVLFGEVVYIDGFGNVVTNIAEGVLGPVGSGSSVRVRVGAVSAMLPLCGAYGFVAAGSPLLVIGSSGLLEVAVNMGSAEKLFGAKVGDRVEVTL